MEKELAPGTRIDHENYGEGIISAVSLAGYEVFFARGGKIELSRSNKNFEVIDLVESTDDSPKVSLSDLEKVFNSILEQTGTVIENIDFAEKWNGGTLIMKPADEKLKPHEIPLESFFHKIVMVRDRLRVLEQNINSHAKLTDEDKVNLQQYITRIYGSLTSFNIIFKNKDDHFVGTGK
ncbi:MAG: hypothetical protein WCP52_01130 [Bacteroidota bacterium]